MWSRALAPGYLDHPPMVALWIWAGTALAGSGALGVRLLAPLAAALGSLLLARAAEDLLPGRRAGLCAAGLLNATLMFGVGAVTMTPDTPLLLFWTGTLWALARLHATGRPGWWLAAGAMAGLGLDSKYTALLLAPAVLPWLLAAPGARRWLGTIWPWLAAALALALFAPVLAWNAAQGWASFVKQGGRAGDWDSSRMLQFLGELIGGQALLATPLLAVLLAAGLGRAVRGAWSRDPVWLLLAGLGGIPALVFVQHALGDRVQANWPAVIYPATAVAVAGLSQPWRRWLRPAMGLGLVVTALAYVQALATPFPLPPRLDPVASRLGGWDGLAAEVATAARTVSAGFVAVENYGDAAEMARLLPADLPVVAVDSRWRFFRLADARDGIAGRAGLLLRPGRHTDAPDTADWTDLLRLPDPARRVRGVVVAPYQLYRVIGRAGATPAVLLPRAD